MTHYEMILIGIIAFICELVDSSLGMGYGTTLTPIMLAMGFEPMQIVPAVLCSEALTGMLAGFFHQEFGNVDLRPGSRDFKVALLLTGCSAVGVLIAALLAVKLPAWSVKLYIGILVLTLGIYILSNHSKNYSFSWLRIGGLGTLAAFNKGISGGGYGPVVTAGQVLSGVRGRQAVGITSLAEGVTSIIGFIIYWVGGVPLDYRLLVTLAVGAVLSVPLSAYLVSRIPAGKLTVVIGGITTCLGGYTLINLMV